MRNTQRALLGAVAVTAATTLVGCQNLDAVDAGGTSDGDGSTLVVGFVTPLTGGLATFGESDEWVVDQMQAYFDANPIVSGDGEIQVEIRLEDSKSSADTAGQAAQRLIDGGAQVLLAHATPETTVPVSLACIQNAIPCITADTPLEPWALSVVGPSIGADTPAALAEQADADIDWVHHFFWGLGEVVQTYISIWDQADTNRKVAGLFPNDADGQAWSGALPGILEGAGYTMLTPTLYDSGTTDFTSLINQFKAEGVEIVTGVVPPQDFAAFWSQAQAQGFQPEVVTVAKATEFPGAVATFENPAGLTVEGWWTPAAPTTSSLTGTTAEQLAAEYTEATGRQWNVVLGFSEALFEVLAAAVAEGGTDGAAIDRAVGELTLDTIVGELDFTAGPYPNVAVTYPVGAQWVIDDAQPTGYDIVVVSDPFDTGTPVTAAPEPIQY